ncbi:Na+/H+ antiporter NhaA [Streptomyces sp. Wb2n-11]|uniref:Na+/H+ antiporter NhaA n=1 Tax=Streptomyces sp. Wb2n-11 TaxID=1030533 RepID=UPI00350E3D46
MSHGRCPARPFRLPRPAPLPEHTAVTATLRTETAGGLALLAAALVALVWANTPWSDACEHIRHLPFGIPSPGPDLSLQHWTADGPLTLAVVDGLGAVPIIAVSSTGDLHLAAPAGAFAGLPVLSLLQRYPVTRWWWNGRYRGRPSGEWAGNVQAARSGVGDVVGESPEGPPEPSGVHRRPRRTRLRAEGVRTGSPHHFRSTGAPASAPHR